MHRLTSSSCAGCTGHFPTAAATLTPAPAPAPASPYGDPGIHCRRHRQTSTSCDVRTVHGQIAATALIPEPVSSHGDPGNRCCWQCLTSMSCDVHTDGGPIALLLSTLTPHPLIATPGVAAAGTISPPQPAMATLIRVTLPLPLAP